MTALAREPAAGKFDSSKFTAGQLKKAEFKASGASAVYDPWLNGFPYRMPITITNSGSALSNYQSSVTVNTAALISAGKMQSGCQDIRFTGSDGISNLYYWIESGCNSASTKIWVKVASIPSGPSTIYMYYGNASASSASDGSNTFLVWDNFDDNTIDTNKWTTHVKNGGSIAETGGEMKHTNDGDWSGENHYTKTNLFTKTSGYAVRFKIRYPAAYCNGGDNHNVSLFDITAVTWPDAGYDQPSPAVYADVGSICATYDTTWESIIKGNGKYDLTRISGTNYMSNVVNGDITNWANLASTYAMDFNSATYGSHHTYWDNTSIRKYASPEPAASVGTEAYCPASVPSSITVPKGSATSWYWGP